MHAFVFSIVGGDFLVKMEFRGSLAVLDTFLKNCNSRVVAACLDRKCHKKPVS
jgi:hypothetical protein